MTRSIEVIVGTDGSVRIDAVGFEGGVCEKATAFLERALGRPTARTRKPEHYRNSSRRRQQVGG